MKKILVFVLAIMMVFAVIGCGSNSNNNKEVASTNQSVNQESMSSSEESIQNQEPGSSDESIQNQEPSSSKESETKQEVTSSVENTTIQEESQMQNETKSLVVYFSCTGTTKRVAEVIADGVGADLYEIVPVNPYTDADLNWNDNNSRTTKEMNDSSVRPEIAGDILDIGQYDTIYIGYPIWWGEAPRIVDTFVESLDFTGKTVVPFCTSGGSGVGSSDDRLQELAGSGDWKEGHKFNGSSSSEEIMNWVNNL